ncbi:hypothetical protein PH235_04075 [Trichococcus sp. K1Tr]|uniref:hypothetical protein n=1 Tax=Trichococcus sp. K1Tr TaxID=3020847 RepID=UPI00232B4EF6|nr:hypothetical protein [Trichococcus sp. K1Tr]MDB6352727.1 hypothetical protein [Trichococcus sp. K1Tr]
MYKLNEKNECIIENFQNTSAFSSFLPGIVGLKGIPLWTFYINRGQAISSFGIENKDSAISEFLPADKAYQHTPLQGFRTFLKVTRKGKTTALEPFSDPSENATETMTIGMNHLELTYRNHDEKLSIQVRYYSLPHAPIGALVRTVSITNDNDHAVILEAADGLAAIFPAGIENAAYKELGNTLKSWFDVKKVDNLFNFYHLRGSTADTEAVTEMHSGNFYASLVKENEQASPATIIFDRQLIFGNDETLRKAQHFNQNPVSEISKQNQVSTNRVSAGFTLWEGELSPGQSVELMTLVGYGKDVATVSAYLSQHFNEDTVKQAFVTAQTLTDELTDVIQTGTANAKFDQYARQSYLDNGLRGGFPTIHTHKDKRQTYYVYSRKHGDLERDYNFFSTSPTYYSQGNGNYRDINQNRRMDIYFTPEVEAANIHHFMELIQLDGYNPLVIKKVLFTFNGPDTDIVPFLKDAGQLEMLLSFFEKPFEPGELLRFVEENDVALTSSFEELLAYVLCASSENLEADHGEGFWIDHWTYNLDLIESYLAIYPDKQADLLFERPYKYYQNKAFVQPRSKKYVQKDNKYRQYHAIRHEEELGQWVEALNQDPLMTDLYSKLLLLAATKAATIAPFGYGIAMEAGKPGWNDALNGLPGLFGSGTSELFELKRLLAFIGQVDQMGSVQSLPIEVVQFLQGLHKQLTCMQADDQAFWEKTTSLLEKYRESIYQNLSGESASFSQAESQCLVHELAKRVDRAIEAVENYNGQALLPTYFYFEKIGETLTPHAVTPFLEGLVKKLKVTDSTEEAQKIYQAVRESEIYDRKLQMYKTSGPLTNEPIELGRAKFFTPGWLENESVFLHMTYKYLLALLKSGLYEAFYEDLETMLIPNLDPNIYGRSILENSSFIASSANPDESIHGKGFVARLSGSTVEFLNMWVRMFIGESPFTYDKDTKQLSFQLSPALHKTLFREDGTVQFTLLGEIQVTYSNTKRQHTYGQKGVKPIRYSLQYEDDHVNVIEGNRITDQEARDIRNKHVKSMHVTLG